MKLKDFKSQYATELLSQTGGIVPKEFLDIDIEPDKISGSGYRIQFWDYKDVVWHEDLPKSAAEETFIRWITYKAKTYGEEKDHLGKFMRHYGLVDAAETEEPVLI